MFDISQGLAGVVKKNYRLGHTSAFSKSDKGKKKKHKYILKIKLRMPTLLSTVKTHNGPEFAQL